MENIAKIVNDIRNGELDINVQSLFFPMLVKGLMINLRDNIFIRGNSVPHFILHMGDDRLFLEEKGYNFAVEPQQISNESGIHLITPRCIVTPNNIDLDSGQLTSPYSIGALQLDIKNGPDMGIYALRGEFRRIPVKMAVELKYTVDSYTDMMELVQYITANLAFIRTYEIVYMGQRIKCSYKIPDSFSDEHTMELDGAFQEGREHTLSMSLEIESCFPVFNNRTIVSATKLFSQTKVNIHPNEIK